MLFDYIHATRYRGELTGGELHWIKIPDADLAGTVIVVSNGNRDPMIPAEMTRLLAGQFRERGADVVELPHPGGHQIPSGLLPHISSIICRPERRRRPRPGDGQS